jgi:hypothetical protein
LARVREDETSDQDQGDGTASTMCCNRQRPWRASKWLQAGSHTQFPGFDLLPSDAHRTNQIQLLPSAILHKTSEDLVPPWRAWWRPLSRLPPEC